jgi:hypothetical protein
VTVYDDGDSLPYVSQQLRLSRGVSLQLLLWAGFAGRERAAEPALEHRDPVRSSQRATDGGARSIRVLAAASAGIARSAAKSGINARNGATVANSSSSPASCARVLDHGQSSARLTNPATTGLSAV